MSSWTAGDVICFREALRYPALVKRLDEAASRRSPVSDSDLLLDVLETEIAESSAASVVETLLDMGEIRAAKVALHGPGPVSAEDGRILRRLAVLRQELDQRGRQVRGMLLLLRGTGAGEVDVARAEVESLLGDASLGASRPGFVIRRLEAIQKKLERIDEAKRHEALGEIEALRGRLRPGEGGEAAGALDQAEKALAVPERLPRVFQLLELARRALSGTLTTSDIGSLHREEGTTERLLAPRSRFPANVQTAAECQVLATAPDFAHPSEFDKQKLRELLEECVAPEGLVIAPRLLERLCLFIGLAPGDSPVSNRALGSTQRVRIPRPRIPALNERQRIFPGGIHLAVPQNTDQLRIPAFFNQLRGSSGGADALWIFFIPGRLDTGLRERFGLEPAQPHFDLVDVLRLAELPKDRRSRAFQQILLARLPITQRLKPYQEGGPVSAEMFHGREEVIRTLRRTSGKTVLFSGRLMGKSSVLKKIHRDVEEAKTSGGGLKDFSVFVSSRASDPTDALVAELAKGFSGARGPEAVSGFRKAAELDAKARTGRGLTTRRWSKLREIVSQLLAKYRHITILIDEADEFARAEANVAREESLAWQLRDLEMENPEKLRVVFAGFQRIHHEVMFRNGAFANWYGLQVLGPLEADEARKLIVEPFADFGLFFASDAGPDRIIEFTGRHPLLLHYTCSKLMDRVASRRKSGTADDVIVQAGDVETVCRDVDLLARVRQILSYNLDEYPRLKLLTYLILFSSNESLTGRPFSLDSFRIEELVEILSVCYGGQLGEAFDEGHVHSLLQELVALGLVESRGDAFAFSNRAFADMLRGDRLFETTLTNLLAEAGGPEQRLERQVLTLAEEDLERLLRKGSVRAAVAGLPGTLQAETARELFGEKSAHAAATLVVDVAGCTSAADVRKRLAIDLAGANKGKSMFDALARAEKSRLVLVNADGLAGAGALGQLLEQAVEAGSSFVAFGGVDLARACVTQEALSELELVKTRRLRAVDVKRWSELESRNAPVSLYLTDEVAAEIRKVTGGHYPLVSLFGEFARKRHASQREVVPPMSDVAAFARAIEASAKELLLGGLRPEEREALQAALSLCEQLGTWTLEREVLAREVLQPLCERRKEPLSVAKDRLALLRALDFCELSVEGSETSDSFEPEPLRPAAIGES